MKHIKNIAPALMLWLYACAAYAQVSTNVAAFRAEDKVTIIFNAAESCSAPDKTLVGADKVYMHSGVGTEAGNWQFVIGNWGQDDGIGQMTQVEGDIWAMELVPRTYYSVPAGTAIVNLGMVFRDGTGEHEGKEKDSCGDIFIPVSQAPYTLVSTEPSNVCPEETVTIFYNAKEGNAGCVGLSKVYMHGGVVFDDPASTAWSNVVGNWGADDGLGLMTSLGDDNWAISLVPKDYYGLNAADAARVRRLSMVFRGPTGDPKGANADGSDVFYDNIGCEGEGPVTVRLLTFPESENNSGIYDIAATPNDIITITYNAGIDSTLIGEKVYIHSGAGVSAPGVAWENSVGNWGQDDGIGLMTDIGNGFYRISFVPNDYYSVADGETTYRIGFVFRNADGSKVGKNEGDTDFFLDLACTE